MRYRFPYSLVASLVLALVTIPYVVLAVTATHDECTSDELNNGSGHANTECVDSTLQLDTNGLSAGTGTYTSAILNAGSATDWTQILWSPAAPYGKELPNNGVSESGYTSGNADMTDIQLLLHANDTTGTTATDHSGGAYDFTCSNCPTFGSTGVLHDAFTFDGTNDGFSRSTIGNLDNGFDDSGTFSMWLNWSHNSAWEVVFSGHNSGNTQNMHIDINRNGSSSTSAGDIAFWAKYSSGLGIGCGTNGLGINDGNWHHVAVVLNNLSSGTGALQFYVDGNSVSKTCWTSNGGEVTGISSWYIGQRHDGVYYQGQMDEIAVWNRALSSTEIANIYKRGALNASFAVRSCDDSDCSGESFSSPYSELSNTSPSTPSFALSQDNNPYFQYQTTLTGDGVLGPEIEAVTISYGASSIPEFGPLLAASLIAAGGWYAGRRVFHKRPLQNV